MEPTSSVSHTGVGEWLAHSPEHPNAQPLGQAAYEAGLRLGRQEVEAALHGVPASTTRRPRFEARSIFDDWEPSRDD